MAVFSARVYERASDCRVVCPGKGCFMFRGLIIEGGIYWKISTGTLYTVLPK
jgi:hypothetical protein